MLNEQRKVTHLNISAHTKRCAMGEQSPVCWEDMTGWLGQRLGKVQQEPGEAKVEKDPCGPGSMYKGWDGRKHRGLRAWRPVHTRPRDNAPEPDFRWGSREARERVKIRGGKVSLAFQEV